MMSFIAPSPRRKTLPIIWFAGCAVALACSSGTSKRRVIVEPDASDAGKVDGGAMGNAGVDAGQDAGGAGKPDAFNTPDVGVEAGRGANDAGKSDGGTLRDASVDATRDAIVPVSCTVTVTGDVTYSGSCRIFVCSPAGSPPSVDLIADFGDAGDGTINFIGNSAIVGNYDQTTYPGGWNTVARQRGLDIRNYSGSALPAGVSLSANLTSVTLSTDPTDVCAGVVTGTVTGDIVVIGDSGTSHAAHFEFVMK
jgi:hypothetical protein